MAVFACLRRCMTSPYRMGDIHSWHYQRFRLLEVRTSYNHHRLFISESLKRCGPESCKRRRKMTFTVSLGLRLRPICITKVNHVSVNTLLSKKSLFDTTSVCPLVLQKIDFLVWFYSHCWNSATNLTINCLKTPTVLKVSQHYWTHSDRRISWF